MGWYSKNAGTKLAAKLEEIAAMGPDERHSLAEEIDISRLLAERALLIFEKTVIDPPPGTEVPTELKARASETLRDRLQDVSDMVAKASAVRAKLESVVGVEDIGYVVHQVKKILQEELDEVQCRAVTARLDELRLPKQAAVNDEDAMRDMLIEMKRRTTGDADEAMD